MEEVEEEEDEEEESPEEFINNILKEDTPSFTPSSSNTNNYSNYNHYSSGYAPPAPPPSVKLVALRTTLEAADASSSHNGQLRGVVHGRIFDRSVKSILGWEAGEGARRELGTRGSGGERGEKEARRRRGETALGDY